MVVSKADASSRPAAVAVALLRSDTLQAHASLMAAHTQMMLAANTAIGDSNSITVGSLLCFARLTDSIEDSLLLAGALCTKAERNGKIMACLCKALADSGFLTHVCHGLLTLARLWQPPQGALRRVEKGLSHCICTAFELISRLMSIPELAPAGLTPAVQYYAVAPFMEVAVAVDGGPTHGLHAPGVMQLLVRVLSAAQQAPEGGYAPLYWGLVRMSLAPAASVLGSKLCQQHQQLQQARLEAQQQQAEPQQLQQAGLEAQRQQAGLQVQLPQAQLPQAEPEQWQQQHSEPEPPQLQPQLQQLPQAGGRVRAIAAAQQQQLPPALFTPIQAFDLLLRGVDCLYREPAALAGQQAASSAAGGSAAAAGTNAGQRPAAEPQHSQGRWRAARSALHAAACVLDVMAPQQREVRLPRLWRALSGAVAAAAAARWSPDGVKLLQMAVSRLAAPAAPGQASEARAAHQEGFVRAWAAMLRWLGRACMDRSFHDVAWSEAVALANTVPALWRALQEAGAPPCELAQVAVALRKLAAFEAQLPHTTRATWLWAVGELLDGSLVAARERSPLCTPDARADPLPVSGELRIRGAREEGTGHGSSCGSSHGEGEERQSGYRAACALPTSPTQQQRQQQELGQQQQDQLHGQQRTLAASTALTLLPTLSACAARLLRQAVSQRAARTRHGRTSASRFDKVVTLAVTLHDWYAQLALDGACRLGPAPATAAVSPEGILTDPLQQPQLQPGLAIALLQAPVTPAGATADDVGAGPAASVSPETAADAGTAAWRRYLCRQRHDLLDLGAAMLECAAAVGAAPGQGSLDQEALEELDLSVVRAAFVRRMVACGGSQLVLLEVLEPGALTRLLASGGSVASSSPGATAAGGGGGGAAVPGPGRVEGPRAALETLARHQNKTAAAYLEAAWRLGDPETCRQVGAAAMRADMIKAVRVDRYHCPWLPPLADVMALLPAACAYPLCTNLAGACEGAEQPPAGHAAHGGGPPGLALRACGRCGGPRYCGRDCQVAHWRAGHKAQCEEAQAAAAAAAAAHAMRAAGEAAA